MNNHSVPFDMNMRVASVSATSVGSPSHNGHNPIASSSQHGILASRMNSQSVLPDQTPASMAVTPMGMQPMASPFELAALSNGVGTPVGARPTTIPRVQSVGMPLFNQQSSGGSQHQARYNNRAQTNASDMGVVRQMMTPSGSYNGIDPNTPVGGHYTHDTELNMLPLPTEINTGDMNTGEDNGFGEDLEDMYHDEDEQDDGMYGKQGMTAGGGPPPVPNHVVNQVSGGGDYEDFDDNMELQQGDDEDYEDYEDEEDEEEEFAGLYNKNGNGGKTVGKGDVEEDDTTDDDDLGLFNDPPPQLQAHETAGQ